MISRIKYTFSLLLLSAFCFSQTFNFKNYSTEQGLPQSQVLCIYQDSKGYMWFGTNSGGVAKFDGNNFYTLNSNDGLVDDVVFSVLEDDKKGMFFGTSNGLSVYSHRGFKNYDEKSGLTNTWIYSLLEDNNQIWIGTQKGVFLFKEDKIVPFTENEVLENSSIYKMLLDDEGNIWFGTIQNGVVLFDRKNNKFHHFTDKEGLTNNFIFSLYKQKNGTIMVGTQTGLNFIDKKLKVREAYEIPSNKNNSYSGIVVESDSKYFFGTFSDGMFYFDFKTNQQSGFYHSRNGFTNNPVITMMRDREGNMWIGTDGAGIYKFVNNKFIYYTKSNGLPENYINAVVTDNENNLWVAVNSMGVTKISKGQMVTYTQKGRPGEKLTDRNVNTILNADGKVYFGTNEGLCYYQEGKINIVQDPQISAKYISSLYQDHKTGAIWIGTNVGAFKLQNGKISEEISVNKLAYEGIDLLVLFTIRDKNDRLIFGTENGIIIHDGKKAYRVNEKNGYIKSRTSCAVLDSRNNLWFGTADGVYHYDYKSFSKISKQQGYANGFVNFLQFDGKNKLYIGSNNGVDILNTDSFYAGKTSAKHLGKEDGLLSLESNFNSATLSADGRVLIGTIKGLQIYNPALDVKNNIEPSLHITDVKLFYGQENVTYYSKGIDSISLLPLGLRLPYAKNNITFKYVGISLIAPEKVMYKYKLEGLDENWTPEVSKTEVTYPSLPPGTYTFMVVSMNNDGLWNKEPVSFVFEIRPPWYKTTWFYFIVVLSLITGIVSYNYFKTKKLKADKQKLELIVNERTGELRAEKEKVELINKEVIQQKAEIEHKNQEITDSIKYAKNIQEALLPDLEETENAFNECFIIYLPKDIVSGDFFWFSKKPDKYFIAAADCTGHGVPGAFMSIVGNNLLNEIINVKGIHNPGDILLELHRGVKKALHQDESENSRRDGMDIALCAIDKQMNRLDYSGANRPLWIFRKEKAYELEIIKPNKFPIGGLELDPARKYENNNIPLHKGDVLYIFSDGFADQFGGPKGKKFMLANMQKLLKDYIHLPMPNQKEKITEAFKLWKNDLEQVDDVLVIGIRV